MTVPRAGRTASPLPDGRVVIAGGSSEPFFSVEIYDPATDLFTFAASASLARSGHAAAVLGDGRVLFVGGTVDGVPTRAADIYDPETGSLITAPDMQVARTGHTATSLLGGKQVLITGGHDGISDLASAELFTVADEQFTLVSSTLAVPRRGHAAFLLPNNNAVLIVGGWSVDAGVGATELFQPWTGQFTPAAPREFGLSGLAGSGTVKEGVFLVAGGANESGVYAGVDLYGFATVKTDKDDYAPGETVVITGTGWQPGETVVLLLQEDVSPPFHEDLTLFATADENGAIINTEYSPETHDIGVMFYLTATGAGAQAQNHFWDHEPPGGAATGADLLEPDAFLFAGDYVMFAQARVGTAGEGNSNGSNDAQASVSGSNNSLFGRIRSNADFSSSGQNNYFHYEGNGPTPPDQPTSTVNDGKVTFRFLNEDGDNHYENPLNPPNGDPRFKSPVFTGGTWEPVESAVPVGPVAAVSSDPYKLWPGNMHTAVKGTNYLEMDTDILGQLCDGGDFGLLTQNRDFDLTEDSADGTYCTRGGKITVSVENVGEDAPKRFTLLAKNGLIEISGQNATFEPFELGILAMSDMESSDEQFPIKISGSNLSVPSQAILFAPRAGVTVSGSEESVLCLQLIGQETQISGSTSGFGLRFPGCRLLGDGSVFGHVFEDTNGNGVQDDGEPGLGDVDVVITDALGDTQTVATTLDFPVTTTDEGGHYSADVPAGETTADVNELTLPAELFQWFQTAGVDPSTVTVLTGSDTDIGDDGYQPRGELAIAKVASVPGDTADVTGEVISYTLTVTNFAGGLAIAGVAVDDAFTDDEAPVLDVTETFNVGDLDFDDLLDVTESWSYTASHTVTQDDLDAGGTIDNVATATGDNAAEPATADASVPVDQTKTLAIEKVASVPGGTADVTGEVISYTMTVTSAGSNAAIAGVVVDDMFTDDLAPVLDGGFNVGDLDDDGLLDVGESWIYTASHAVTQDEFDAGLPIVNTATATGTDATPDDDDADGDRPAAHGGGRAARVAGGGGVGFEDLHGELRHHADGHRRWVGDQRGGGQRHGAGRRPDGGGHRHRGAGAGGGADAGEDGHADR